MLTGQSHPLYALVALPFLCITEGKKRLIKYLNNPDMWHGMASTEGGVYFSRGKHQSAWHEDNEDRGNMQQRLGGDLDNSKSDEDKQAGREEQ
jgi:hypothetical protein